MSNKKVLIIKLGAIGDIVHTSIICEAIKSKHPDWTIDFLTSKDFVKLLENHPYIDNIIPWEQEYKSLKGFFEIIKLYFSGQYDYYFSPTLSLRTFIFSILTFPKKFKFKKKLGGMWVEDYFQMARTIVKDIQLPKTLTLGVSEEANLIVENEIKNYARPYFVIAPGRVVDNTRQGRLWNVEKWKELTNKLISEYGGTVFVVGSKYEREVHKVLENENIIIKSGEYELEHSKAILSKADLVISGDTGPIHIASAFNVKTLALLGSTDPKHIKPYGENGYYVSADYECLYCWKKKCPYLKKEEKYTPCMEKLTVEKVFEKVKEIIRT